MKYFLIGCGVAGASLLTLIGVVQAMIWHADHLEDY